MTKDEVLKLARANESNNPFLVDFKFSEDGLLAFANVIAEKQREEDAQICDELSLCSGGGKATTLGGACLECGDAIRANKE